jgi:GR25 family glycosyltransferase involved in LPS biosynthesis
MIHPRISHSFYINLAKREDRKEHMESQFKDYHITDYERFEAVHREDHGIVGCGYSHLGVLKLARERNYENVLIFEDDFRFVVSAEEMAADLDRFFGSPIAQDFDVCMLAYNLRESAECPEHPFLTRVLFAQAPSAYVVHSRYYDTLIQLLEWAIPLLDQTGQHWIYANDVVWKDLQRKDKWFCFTKRMGKQLDGYSDNTKRVERYDC